MEYRRLREEANGYLRRRLGGAERENIRGKDVERKKDRRT
jgi:hypothetical protein